MDQQKLDNSTVLSGLMDQASANPGRTKRSAARLAIAEAIRNGTFGPGDYLPSETALTRMLGVSLGTVQAALRQLQQMGAIARRRGDGTRVASTEPLGRDIWHFRFLDKKGQQPLRISEEHVSIVRTGETGAWTEFLGGDPDYVCVSRRITMQDGTPAGAQMFLSAAAVPGLETVDPRELDMVNIRPFLEEAYGLGAASASHLVQTSTLEDGAPKILRHGRDSTVFDIHAKARTNDGRPVYYQRIIISAEACCLSF